MLDHLTDFDNNLLTREILATPLQVRFLTDELIYYKLAHTYEFLEESFNIYNDITIPDGEHSFLWHTVSFSSAQRRLIWGGVDYRFGEFYNGTRKEIKLKAGYKVFVPLFIGGELIRNNVQLPEDGFVAIIYRLNLNVLFSPDITLSNYLQYDNKSGKMGWQSRFRWIIKPGKEVFFVWNSIAADPYERFQIQETSARLKLKYTIRF